MTEENTSSEMKKEKKHKKKKKHKKEKKEDIEEKKITEENKKETTIEKDGEQKKKKDKKQKKDKSEKKLKAEENIDEEPRKKKQKVENTEEVSKKNAEDISKQEKNEDKKEEKHEENKRQRQKEENNEQQPKEGEQSAKKKKKNRQPKEHVSKARGCFIGQIPLLDRDIKSSKENKLATIETLLKKHFQGLELPLPTRTRLLTNKKTWEFRGMAFCDFKTKEECEKVIEQMHHTTFGTVKNKKRINVESLILDRDIMRKNYEDKIDAIIEKYKMCDNFVYWDQNGDKGGTGHENTGGNGIRNQWGSNNDWDNNWNRSNNGSWNDSSNTSNISKPGEKKSILENDHELKKFLYSVSLHCAESTLLEASTLVGKFPKKCKDFGTTLRDEKCKYLMGMLKQRC